MLPSFKATQKFLAATALAGLGLIAYAAQPPAAAGTVKPATVSAEDEYKGWLNKYGSMSLPSVNYNATLNTDKFKKGLAYVLENSVRSGLNEADLRKAARAGMNSFVENVQKKQSKLPVNAETLMTAALSGMLSYVSPHDNYIPASKQQEFRDRMNDTFVGIGAMLEQAEDLIRIANVIEGSPAEKAGVKEGDIIHKVNGTSIKGMPMEEAINLIRGKPGTTVSIEFQRNQAPLTLEISRAQIKQSSAAHSLLDGGVGYVHLRSFTETASMDIRHAIAKLKAEALITPGIKAAGGLKGLILDLRGNPGGLLAEARSIADDFLNVSGLVTSSQGRNPDYGERLTAVDGDIVNGLPVVVLVNEGSASASEVVAGALQDHERVTVMGADTFGKGTVQEIRSDVFGDGSLMKLTIAMYKRPSGTSPQFVGIRPDIRVDPRNDDYEKAREELTFERKLPRSIPNPRGMEAEQNRIKAVCSPTNEGLNATAQPNSNTPLYYKAGPLKGRMDAYVGCARDFLLQKANPGYQSTLTQTAPTAKP
ncbi:MAG: S41 family peptidase [Micavibrio aeruginosavorus]|uniref:S41 family peptidase n=1 Tax=Micavibrio aeruginosavorus TaxID=349221 RepID=A0A7T5UGM4_9BACT|nr:MAG: S41 family peptidase [Micavibrio aeruginosavorus]